MLHDLRGTQRESLVAKGGPFSLTRAEMESGRDERHPPVFSHPSRLRIFNGGNIYPAKGWKLVPTVFKLLLGGKIISLFFFCTKHRHTFCGCCSVAKSCLTLCNPVDCSTPGRPGIHIVRKYIAHLWYYIFTGVGECLKRLVER